MIRPTPLLEEARALRHALTRHPRMKALRQSSDWASLEPRLAALLATVRTIPRREPHPPDEGIPGTVRAAHWNIEKGVRFKSVLNAFRTRPEFQDCDLISLNEVDLGMARSGNMDIAAALGEVLGLHVAWAPMFLELTSGRDDDATYAAGRPDAEGILGLAILSRWPIQAARAVPLPSPERVQFDSERMFGHHAALVAEVLRPGAPFLAVSAHLEVHRTRDHRADQMEVLLADVAGETRPVILAGDFNTHTFDRGGPLDALRTGSALAFSGTDALLRRLRAPEHGRHREPLFAVLRAAGFEWESFNDREATLHLRFDRIPESAAALRVDSPRFQRWVRRVEARAALRLDWFAGRGWRTGSGRTVPGLDGRKGASDHAPIVAEFRHLEAG